jgi:hypothetical protein
MEGKAASLCITAVLSPTRVSPPPTFAPTSEAVKCSIRRSIAERLVWTRAIAAG